MMKKALLMVFGILVLNGCMPPENGDLAPDFNAELIDGTSFKLSDLKGQYVVLDFWGSWCGPCMRDIPELMKLHNKYGDQVVFVTVALEKGGQHWKTVADKAGFSWKHQIVEKSPMVLASEIARSYGVTEIPAKFLIKPNGTLISGLGFEQIDALLNAELNHN